jgi:hypothetical protein
VGCYDIHGRVALEGGDKVDMTNDGEENHAAGSDPFFKQAVQAATQVRRELPELMPEQASQLGGELDRLLSGLAQAGAAERQRSLDEILELLSGSPTAQRRFGELLAADSATRSTSDYGPLEGDPVSGYDRWLCPTCTYVFPVIDLETPPPGQCPNDKAALYLQLAEG